MIDVKFWGVRGSRPNTDVNLSYYGGNTSCVSIEFDESVIVFDCGTGVIKLGNYMLEKGLCNAHIFISHYHMDHIQGLPFFTPLFSPNSNLFFYGEDKYGKSVRELLNSQMKPPFFPVSMAETQAHTEFVRIEDTDVINVNKATISFCQLNHPGGALAFKFERDGKKIIYASDSEFLTGSKRKNFLEFAYEADIIIYDSQYTELEYNGISPDNSKIGWGHSTIDEAIEISTEALAKMIILFHHNENRTDDEIRKLENKFNDFSQNIIFAREGLIIKL